MTLVLVGIVVGWFAIALLVGLVIGAVCRDPEPPSEAAQERAAQATTRPHGTFRQWPYGHGSRW